MTAYTTLRRRLPLAFIPLALLAIAPLAPAQAQTPTGTSFTLPDGNVCSYAGSTTAPMTFNGVRVDYTCTRPNTVLVGAPQFRNNVWVATVGNVQNGAITSTTEVPMDLAQVDLVDNSSCTLVSGTPVTISGQPMSYTCGNPNTGLLGGFNTGAPLWTSEKITTSGTPPAIQSRQTVAVRSAVGRTPSTTPTPTPTPQPGTATAIRLPDGAMCNWVGGGTTPTFNGQPVNYNCGSASNNGTRIILGTPTADASGVWTLTDGIMDPVSGGGFTLRSSQTITMIISQVELVDNTICNWASGTGTATTDGQRLTYTCGRPEEGLIGSFNTSQPLWTTEKVILQPGGQGPTISQRATLGIRTATGSSTTTPSGQATSITLPDATVCRWAGGGAAVTFQGQPVNYTCTNPNVVIIGTPTFQNGVWTVTQGNMQGAQVASTTTVTMVINFVDLVDGSRCASAGQGATISINGQRLNYTCGDPSSGLFGDFNTSQPLWTANKATGIASTPTGFTATSTAVVGITNVVGATPPTTPAPVPPPQPAPGPGQPAPPQTRDNRFFPETGFRIGNDAFYNFYISQGQVETFGFPVSRVFTFLGCPVQIFQRLIMQQCGTTAPVSLLNLLDPELFPYTRVNGSTFPGPDDAIKNSTPSVGSPNYDTAIIQFVQTTVPDTWNGNPVQFQQTFFNSGGLEIWGTPISNPAADPANASFIYQRFQRGIMHYTAGQGTRGILLADYLKAIMLGPEQAAQKGANLPPDLNEEARTSYLYTQYCPTLPAWVCRPQDLAGSDLTFAFEAG